jgi:hypothetical protein
VADSRARALPAGAHLQTFAFHDLDSPPRSCTQPAHAVHGMHAAYSVSVPRSVGYRQAGRRGSEGRADYISPAETLMTLPSGSENQTDFMSSPGMEATP